MTTDSQAFLDIFNGRDPGRVLWQPRIEFWYAVNKKRGTLPRHLQNASLLDVFDMAGEGLSAPSTDLLNGPTLFCR